MSTVHAVPPRPRASARFVVRLALALLIPFAGLTACDGSGDDDPTGNTPDVTGTWVTTSNGLTVFVRITSSTVEIYDGLEAVCFNSKALSIVSSSGESFTLNDGSSSFTATLRREGDQLRAIGLMPGANWLMDSTSQNPASFDECQIEGTWTQTEGSQASTVVVTPTSYTAYDGAATGCREVYAFEITDRDGDDYVLTSMVGDELELTIRNEAGTLVVTFANGFTLRYDPSTDDPSTFDICGGGDESATACADLPPITVGGTINGELTTSDPLAPIEPGGTGYYYDLYGLTLASAQQVRIDESSSVIDPLLRLWDADGNFVAVNDDNATSLNSTIEMMLDAGCYIVEASSYDWEETGAYTLTVN